MRTLGCDDGDSKHYFVRDCENAPGPRQDTQNWLQPPQAELKTTTPETPNPETQIPAPESWLYMPQVLVNLPLLAANWLAIEAAGCQGTEDQAELEARTPGGPLSCGSSGMMDPDDAQ